MSIRPTLQPDDRTYLRTFMTERFTSPAGNVGIAYDEKSATVHVSLRFRGWGAEYEERRVSGTADAIQRVLKRLEYEPDAVEMAQPAPWKLTSMTRSPPSSTYTVSRTPP